MKHMRDVIYYKLILDDENDKVYLYSRNITKLIGINSIIDYWERIYNYGRRRKTIMGYTINELIESKQFPGIQLINNVVANQEIKNVRIIAVSDMEKFTGGG